MNSLPNYEPTNAEMVPLESHQIEQAIAISRRVSDPEHRWQVYLNALALAGFEQWLQTRTTEIRLDASQCRILEANSLDAPTAVCQLQANDFKLCLIAIPSFPDSVVTLPDRVIDHSNLMAQFYIPIAIYEEAEQVSIQGFLRYDELMRNRNLQSIRSDINGTYSIPSSWFDSDLDRLLLYLSCLDPVAIPLPTPAIAPLPLRQLWVQPVINVGRWIQQQVNDAVDWVMLPPLNLAPAMRGAFTNLGSEVSQPIEELAAILTNLIRGGMQPPDNARTAYQELQLGDRSLRLYAMVAPLTNAEEWSLLLILRSSTNQPLQGISLQVSDGVEVIVNQTLDESVTADFLYGTAIGTYDEQFILTIALADGTALTLPPFAFQSDVI
ncbi:MAG: DUF1822 family protein [Leptolyngbyaceae cyanobacterium CSU_1_3]|nr:DUF1822 family protein [Leptolyngbyaceae cyanobacterium CSU_1_3]